MASKAIPTALRNEEYGPLGDASRHRPLAELEAGLRALAAAPTSTGHLALLVCRRADGVRETPERAIHNTSPNRPGNT